MALTEQRSAQNRDRSPLIRKDRPSVYIEFERSGKASPLFEGEKEERIWVKLHNNTRWAIEFCSFSVGGIYGGIGVVHEVKRIYPGLGLTKAGSKEDEPIKQSHFTKMPQGYSTGDTCSPYLLGAGKAITFSVPRVHLGENMYLEFEFWPQWENRENALGNFPQYYVSFSNSDLPRNERVR